MSNMTESGATLLTVDNKFIVEHADALADRCNMILLQEFVETWFDGTAVTAKVTFTSEYNDDQSYSDVVEGVFAFDSEGDSLPLKDSKVTDIADMVEPVEASGKDFEAWKTFIEKSCSENLNDWWDDTQALDGLGYYQGEDILLYHESYLPKMYYEAPGQTENLEVKPLTVSLNLKLYLPPSLDMTESGYFDHNGVVTLLRKYKGSPESIQFIADMLD